MFTCIRLMERQNSGLNRKSSLPETIVSVQLQDIRLIIEEHHDSLIAAWRQHFPGR